MFVFVSDGRLHPCLSLSLFHDLALSLSLPFSLLSLITHDLASASLLLLPSFLSFIPHYLTCMNSGIFHVTCCCGYRSRCCCSGVQFGSSYCATETESLILLLHLKHVLMLLIPSEREHVFPSCHNNVVIVIPDSNFCSDSRP